MIRNIMHKIKCKISEPYRIRVGFGLSPIRSKRELKALFEFCKAQLKEDYIELNPVTKKIFEQTVYLYNKQVVNNDWSTHSDTHDDNIYSYIEDNCGWYWS